MRDVVYDIFNMESVSKNIEYGFGIYPKHTRSPSYIKLQGSVNHYRDGDEREFQLNLCFLCFFLLFLMRPEVNLESVNIKTSWQL